MDDMERTAATIRDGKQAADARHQAEVELEQGLVAREQELERGTGAPIVEQADGGATPQDEDAASDVVVAGQGSGSNVAGVDGDGTSIAEPGAGTDASETSTSHGGA